MLDRTNWVSLVREVRRSSVVDDPKVDRIRFGLPGDIERGDARIVYLPLDQREHARLEHHIRGTIIGTSLPFVSGLRCSLDVH